VKGIYAGALAFAAWLPPLVAAPAQEPLGGRGGWQLVPFYEHWRFDDGSVERARSAWQWSFPVVGVATLGRVTVDAYAAYAVGEVEAEDLLGATTHARLSGMTDLKLRAVTRLVGDRLLLTAGVNVPTGARELEQEELGALRVLGSPILRFATPAFGTGPSGTLGVVVARPVGEWSVGFGAAAEVRGSYAPVDAAQFGFGDLDLDPGEAFRISLGADRLVGQSAMSVSASATIYTSDELSGEAIGVGTPLRATVRLGPAFTAEWRMRVAARGFRALDLFVHDRYRTRQEGITGTKENGTSANELDVGARGEIALGRRLGLTVGLDGRHHTGLEADRAMTTAGIVAGGMMLGLSVRTGAVTVLPFVRGTVGRIDNHVDTFSANGWGAGLTLGSRF
jgi:hypothetical protein